MSGEQERRLQPITADIPLPPDVVLKQHIASSSSTILHTSEGEDRSLKSIISAYAADGLEAGAPYLCSADPPKGYEPIPTDLVDCFLAASLARTRSGLASRVNFERITPGFYRMRPSGMFVKLAIEKGRLVSWLTATPTKGLERCADFEDMLRQGAAMR